MRTADEILTKFAGLRLSTAGKSRAPHKPLLVLLSLSMWQHTRKQHFTYDDVAEPLKRILREFLPASVKQPSPAMPFFHLKNDAVWQLVAPQAPEVLANLSEPSVGVFRQYRVFGTFPDDIWAHLEQTQDFLWQIVGVLLVNHFEPTLYKDVLEAVGLEVVELGAGLAPTVWEAYYRRRRDPTFKLRVLESYSWRCAVCGFQASLHDRHVGVEAAHVQWHSHDGPDIVPNGVALCALHHHLFDRGVFTINQQRKVEVSPSVTGSQQFIRSVEDFHGREMLQPSLVAEYIDDEYISWHVSEVFHD